VGTFVGGARRGLLDHVLLIDDQHLADLLRQYGQALPAPQTVAAGGLSACDACMIPVHDIAQRLRWGYDGR
jgi:hypothetical protein